MLGARLKQLRLAQGLTQAQLGAAVGVGKSAVSQYESGARIPDAATLVRLAACLGTSTDWLLGAADQPDWTMREPRTAYGADAPPDERLAAFLAELAAEARSIRDEDDRRAVLELAKFMARKERKRE